MKIFNKINYLLLGGLFLLGSCGEEFLEETPTDTLTTERLGKVIDLNPRAAEGTITGLYSFTFQYNSGGTYSHDDFGQKSIDIATDIICGDMAQLSHAYGKFEGASNLTGTNQSENLTYQTWRYYYQILRVANDLIASFKDKMPNEDKAKWNFGQVKAIRAYAYLNLVNLYQNPYLEAKDKKALVLQLVNDDKPKGLSTTEEIYKVIIGDLETAVKALEGFQRANKSSINQNVARGLLTYAYLFKGEYAKAEATANAVIASNEFPLMSKEQVVKSGFNNVNIPGWMWAIDLTTSNTPQLPTFWGMIDVFTYSYSSVTGWAINKELYEQIPETDIRKQQFAPIDATPYPLRPMNKFFHKDRVFGTQDWTSDEVYMRVAEMYLAKAEAQARQGDNAGAKATLLQLLAERDTDATNKVNALSGQALLDEIYFQWRIEMWGEGKAFWAMKRFKKSNTRGSNSFMFPGQSFKYNDSKLVYKIPEIELNSNPEISK